MSTLSWIVEAVSWGMESNDLLFCLYCSLYSGTSVVGATFASVFNDAIIETGSPALALQAFLTSTLRTAYYTWLPLFDATATATTVSYVDRLAPVSHRGYWAVLGILAVHVLVCGTITTLSLRNTRLSLIGHVWSSIAQVANDKEVAAVLQDVGLKTDKEVAKELKGQGLLRRRYRVVSTDEDDGIALAPVAKDPSKN